MSRLGRDFRRLRTIKGWSAPRAFFDALLLDAGFQAVLLHRIAHALLRWRIPVLPALCRRLSVAWCGVDILPHARIGGGLFLPHTPGIVIGGRTIVGEDCTVLHGVTLGEARFDSLDCPRLGQRVTVGAGAQVLGGVTIGDGAMIGAGAVVLDSVPAGAVAAGVPARVVSKGSEEAMEETAPDLPRRPLEDTAPDLPRSGSANLLLLIFALSVAGLGPPAQAALLPGVCDPDTVVTLVGLDTRSGRALFHLSDPGGDRPPGLLEVPSEGGLAFLHRPDKPVFGGSVGPGPVLAFTRCGESCLEVLAWRDGGWLPLEGRVEAPAATTVHATWDRTGTAWVVALGQTETPGRQRAWAFHRSGDAWTRHGPLDVDAVGEPAAVPDPDRRDAVLVGSGRFTPDGPARSWLAALPDLPREQMAEVFPLGTGSGDAGPSSAVVLAADGSAFLTKDGGASWQRAGWAPPAAEGPEVWLDRPTGDRSGGPGVVWVDGKASRPALILAEVERRGDDGSGWMEVARIPSEVVTDTGASLTFEHYLRPDGRRWWLLTGCVDTPETSGLVARGPQDLTVPRFISIAEP